MLGPEAGSRILDAGVAVEQTVSVVVGDCLLPGIVDNANDGLLRAFRAGSGAHEKVCW